MVANQKKVGDLILINEYPNVCNKCGGKVVFIDNKQVYGRSYGSGKCYLCTRCKAYVGTHNTGKKDKALGLLADERMRKGKIYCHELFDKQWKYQGKKRGQCYKELANKLGIDIKCCHFGHFDLETLRRAYIILKKEMI